MTMTSDAKSKLSKTIRALRERLLTELSEATDREYRLSVRSKDANLNFARTTKRKRLEDWLAEQVRGETGKQKRAKDDFRRDAEKQAAYTLLNRLVILRIMETTGLRKPLVVTGGWNSRGYKDFRELAPALVRNDDSEGYSFLLQLIFEDLATDLPGLYGSAGIADLIPVPSATIRAVVEAFDDPELESCWTDDMTLGWVYQYWNDPEREALDAKINDGGKIEPHEIASKTQMFTERYMVDWLLQNSLGPMWLAMCKKHGWIPDVEADGTLERLEQRRVEWRARRDAGDVELTDLMPLETDAERRWAYCVPQPIPDDAVEHAPQSVRDLKILDPAVGSGHFLVVAFDLLIALYREEARHRGEADADGWSDVAIIERILEHNLHGIDLDPRAVQIAAAALWLKSQQVCPDARPKQLNLVASNLRLGSLPHDDPALVTLRQTVERESGIPATLTDSIVQALAGADHLGSLLKVDAAIDAAIDEFERSLGWETWGDRVKQLNLFPDGRTEQQEFQFSRERVERGLLTALEEFLSRHTSAQELGLRLHGEQLAAGVRFVRMVKAGTYNVVIANPPYQGTGKMRDSSAYEKAYPVAKTDLFAGMTVRALELLRPSGVCAMIAISNWMYLKSFLEFRTHVLTHHLFALADLGKAAFSTGGTLISTACYVVRNVRDAGFSSVAIRPMTPAEVRRDELQPQRAEAALLLHRGRHHFDPAALQVVPEWPLVYWWDEETLGKFTSGKLIQHVSPARKGLDTGDNTRFVRLAFEVKHTRDQSYAPLIQGAKGHNWVEPHRYSVEWRDDGLQIRVAADTSAGANIRNDRFYFRRGVAFALIGSAFSARVHRYPSVIAGMGSSVFPDQLADAVCAMNSSQAREILTSLNPGVHFEVGDVNRLPLFPIANADEIFAQVEAAFGVHEAHREASVEFTGPGPSPWRAAQEWAQLAVDRPEGTPLPDYVEQLDPEPPTDHLSFALGVALGRFGANGEGVLDPQTSDLSHALPEGVLFLDGTLTGDSQSDSLGHPAAQIIHDKWEEFGAAIDSKRGLRDWLRDRFFKDVHRQMYENRPIHWPLSSAGRTFVAWVNIHRWNEQTLRILLADHLQPTLKRLDGELADLTAARGSGDRKEVREAESRYDDVKAWHDELADFIANVEQCADKGPAPPDPKKPQREVDARYVPDLDDGVMINSAALWPLLDPQWKDPQKWWKELVASKGKKDYDWSHLAMRYWPNRVDKKCQSDPSLGVAHGCFWKYHPARAWAWELRLQDEIGPDFRIEEAPYRGDGGHMAHRKAYIADNPAEAAAAIAKEIKRRIKKHGRELTEMRILESGIWSQVPAQCWELELATSGTLDTDFRLHAPDSDKARSTFIYEQPFEALAIVEAEIRRRDQPSELRLIDAGLWDSIPEECWRLERHFTRLYGQLFRLIAPDEKNAREDFIRNHASKAIEILKEDIEARRPTKKKPLLELPVPDAGLWSALPEQCWELELGVVKTQQDDFRIIAPDEESARAGFEQANPQKVKERRAIVAKFSFGDDESSETPGRKKKAAKKRTKKKKSTASEAQG